LSKKLGEVQKKLKVAEQQALEIADRKK